MRIGDENLFEIGCRKWKDLPWSSIYYYTRLPPLSPLTLNAFVFTQESSVLPSALSIPSVPVLGCIIPFG